MRSMVVLFAVLAAAAAGYVPLAQPPHHPAVVLDPHGRPLDTAEVIAARALHLQAKHLEHAPLAYAAPLSYAAYPAHAHALYAHGYNAPLLHSHLLKKRSLAHYAYSAPLVAHVAPSAVSHQSRVDIVSRPAVVAHAATYAVAAPVLAHPAPLVAHVAPAAVSHQSRVDVRTSPAVVAHAAAVAPVAHYAPLHYSSPLLHHSSPLLQHAW